MIMADSYFLEGNTRIREIQMKKTDKEWRKDGYLLRLSRREDAENYYTQNFCPLDAEVIRLTGSRQSYTREEVVGFFLQCVQAEDRYDFLLIAGDGRIVGESVINEIDWKARSGNFRIVIFQPDAQGKGLGSWAVQVTRDFAFEELKLHRLSLDVFSFKERARIVYLAAGFREEGVLKSAVLDGEEYADDILMAILEEEWRDLNGKV